MLNDLVSGRSFQSHRGKLDDIFIGGCYQQSIFRAVQDMYLNGTFAT